MSPPGSSSHSHSAGEMSGICTKCHSIGGISFAPLPDGVHTVTMSIRTISAGHGYAYVLRSVVNVDGDRTAPDQITRYYLEAGTPPGFWLCKGVAHLDHGELVPGQMLTST